LFYRKKIFEEEEEYEETQKGIDIATDVLCCAET
jgi:hypothetical protein